jgi:hypothetical protein
MKHFRPVLAALSLFLVWTLATWFFEGRIRTLLRADAALDRLIYAVVVNMLIGIGGSVLLVRRLSGPGGLAPRQCGYGSAPRAAACAAAGAVAGVSVYLLGGGPRLQPVVMLNLFAQTLVVSAAEVCVCWSLLGAAVENGLRTKGKACAAIGASLVTGAAFGAYHFAHSPPFDSMPMVMLLTAVGWITSAFFFMSRDVIGTAIFHNFLAVLGVANALAAAGRLSGFTGLQLPLLGTALAVIAGILAAYHFVRLPPRHASYQKA